MFIKQKRRLKTFFINLLKHRRNKSKVELLFNFFKIKTKIIKINHIIYKYIILKNIFIYNFI